MEKDTFSGALLAWVKGKNAFLKVQAGTGDNLLDCDIREGFTDYCLWSTFRPESIDTDGELDMECLDSGMVLFRESCTPQAALESSYRQAFGTDFDKDDCFVILSGGSLPLPAAASSWRPRAAISSHLPSPPLRGLRRQPRNAPLDFRHKLCYFKYTICFHSGDC